jgi:hypothetical protein
MMIITYIMGHTLTISEDTLPSVISSIQPSKRPSHLLPHTSPRLANRQLKFFFHVVRETVYKDILKWLQTTLHTSRHKVSTWLSCFCVILGLAMVLEEVQRTIQIQADAKAHKGERTSTDAQQEALNACERIDEPFKLLVGLFQFKYRDRKWGMGSFGAGTPTLSDAKEVDFLYEMRSLLEERSECMQVMSRGMGTDRRTEDHLFTRVNVPFSSETQCQYTSRLVAKFLLPFLEL